MKILCLCDSPTLTSGFARVAQNLFKRWSRAGGATIHCWGIAFLGWGYKGCPYVDEFFPAGRGGEWCQPERLNLFLQQLRIGGYTHVWIMQDTFLLAANGFPEALKNVCTERGIRSLLYFPVDAPLKPQWAEIFAAVDVAVAYTEFGLADAKAKWAAVAPELKKRWKAPVVEPEWLALPHGVDTAIYRPISDRAMARQTFWQDNWVGPDDFLMLNVNAHQRRKDVTRSLELLKALKDEGVPAKLVLHMSAISDQDVNLEAVGEQLGLTVFKDWGHHSQLFYLGQGALPETPTAQQPHSMVELYNVADLYLTTTLGEGWGLGISEALACGTPVAMPRHTACREIGEALQRHGMGDAAVMMDLEDGFMVQELDNSRCRPRVQLGKGTKAILNYYRSGLWRRRAGLTQPVREWLNWDRIAREMLRALRKGIKP